MIKWLFVMCMGIASSFCFADLSVVREVVITPKGVNAAANIGSVNSSVNVRMDLAKVDIYIAKPGDGGLAPIPLNVKATFELINESSHDLKLTVGFPVSNSRYSSFELSHFSVVADGTVREVFRRTGGYPNGLSHEYISGNKESKNFNPPIEKGAKSLFGKQFIGKETFQNLMVWEETFAPTQRKKIEVDYEIEIPLQENKVVRERVESSSKGTLSEAANGVPVQFLQKVDSGSYYFFDYYLTSGASWAGTIGFEEVMLHFDRWWQDLEFYSTIKQGEIGWSNRTLHPSLPIVATYQLRDKEPMENIYFAIRPNIQPLSQKKVNQEKAKERLAEGQALWKKGELEEALFTVEEAVYRDLSNKQSAKVLKSMQLQKKNLDGLLNQASDFMITSHFKEAKRSLEKASLINDQYKTYQEVLHELSEAKKKDDISQKENPHNNFVIEKPAIYLYPQKKQKINISLVINGSMTTSIPYYGEGWSVIVDSNGTIDDQYDYLFYENTLNTIELAQEGWIKKGNELEKWFEIILPKLGLNSKEKKQFKEYWLERLDIDTLYEMKLFSMPFLSKNMTLNIDPNPDTLIRVIFHFKSIKERYKIQNPIIITPERVGFHVLEWGGVLE